MTDKTKSEPQMVDALDLWASEAPQQLARPLSLVRFDTNKRLIVPFTPKLMRVKVHHSEEGGLASPVHCCGDACLLCRLELKAEDRDLVPVYDPIALAVGVVAINSTPRPGSLRAGFTPVLQRIKAGDLLLVRVWKPDPYKFAVSATALPPDADNGADSIAAFQRLLLSGDVDPGDVYPRMDADELTAIPKIAKRMQLMGISHP